MDYTQTSTAAAASFTTTTTNAVHGAHSCRGTVDHQSECGDKTWSNGMDAAHDKYQGTHVALRSPAHPRLNIRRHLSGNDVQLIR